MRSRLNFLYLTILALGIVAIIGWAIAYNFYKANRDNARQTAFLTCLEENSDEQVCLGEMGIYAWYPKDETACVTAAEQIDAIFALEGLPRWPALFRNERCARLDMPHHEEAAIAGAHEFKDRSYVDCYNIDYMAYTCDDIHGRHKRFRGTDSECEAIGQMAFKYTSWELLFENERCWRLGLPHFEPE